MGFDPKELKKLADACRKAGILHFKNADVEFTLAPEVPKSNYKKKQEFNETNVIDNDFRTDSLTDEQLLLWSSESLAAPESSTDGVPN